MNRNENSIETVSKCARLIAMIIFLLMLLSFLIHLCAFGQIIFENNPIQSMEWPFLH